MKTITTRFVRTMLCVISMMMIMQTINTQAQDSTFRHQAWRYGLNLGMQYNTASLGWQQLHGLDFNFHSNDNDIDYIDGSGWGPYVGIFGEYLSTSWWGLQMRISYDVRDALIIDDTRSPIPSFETQMSYLTIEPLFRVDQKLIPNLNMYAGPFIGINVGNTFIYRNDKDIANEEVKVDVEDISKLAYGVQGGFAYDIKFAKLNSTTSLIASPFVEVSWMVNQKGSTDETQNSVTDIWSTNSYRFGIRLSVENINHHEAMAGIIDQSPAAVKQKVVTANLPEDNVILTKNIKGYFPIHPYVFFEKGSREIPPRYTMLNKSQASNFNALDLGDFMKGDLTTKETNIDQLMKTYYNVMNIFADRMRKNPNEKLTLRSTDPEEWQAEYSAQKVKDYLVNIFGINADRISIVTEPPKKISGSSSTELSSTEMIDDENRRVVFVFNNQDMLKPLPYTIRDESSIENDIIFSVGNTKNIRSWDVTITGESKSMYFGPFAYSSARVNPAELMRFLESGKYKALVSMTDNNGNKTNETINFNLKKEKELVNASRYLMLFDYNSSDAMATYERIITKEITPDIQSGNRVIIHGHTDIIGSEEGNQILSQERANIGKGIMDKEFAKSNKNVNVKAIGLGQTNMQYTFNNRYPEGRMYNRNIFIETINK